MYGLLDATERLQERPRDSLFSYAPASFAVEATDQLVFKTSIHTFFKCVKGFEIIIGTQEVAKNMVGTVLSTFSPNFSQLFYVILELYQNVGTDI